MKQEIIEFDFIDSDVNLGEIHECVIRDGGGSGTTDYNSLINLPTLNGKVIKGDMVLETLSSEEVTEIFEEIF